MGEGGQCSNDSGLCIDALANFFFNDVDPLWTRIVFTCCEHENDCYGLPEHVFSPWKCLGKSNGDFFIIKMMMFQIRFTHA